jgi:hypothetical protein
MKTDWPNKFVCKALLNRQLIASKVIECLHEWCKINDLDSFI